MKRPQRAPDALRDQHSASLVALSEHGDLAGVVPLLQVPPLQRANLRYPKSTRIKGQRDRPVPRIRFERDDPQDFSFARDSFGESIPKARKLERPAHIEWEISKLEAEGKQAFHGAQAAMHRRFLELFGQMVGEGLKVEQLHRPQGIVGERHEPLGFTLVGSLGVAGTTVEPECDQLLVGVGLADDLPRGFRRRTMMQVREELK